MALDFPLEKITLQGFDTTCACLAFKLGIWSLEKMQHVSTNDIATYSYL